MHNVPWLVARHGPQILPQSVPLSPSFPVSPWLAMSFLRLAIICSSLCLQHLLPPTRIAAICTSEFINIWCICLFVANLVSSIFGTSKHSSWPSLLI